MEHAALGMLKVILKKRPKSVMVVIVAGPGNNGGDGIALARLLLGDYNVKLIMPLGAKSPMCKIQLKRFLSAGGNLYEDIDESDIVVDALFGSGLSKPLKENIQKIIKKLNELSGYKIAVDIPTGINEDGNIFPIAFKANKTFTMGALKLSLFSDFAKDYTGETKVVSLGVSEKLYQISTNFKLLEKSDLKLPFRYKKNTHKGNFGHLSVIIGAKIGAGVICALSGLRFGSGLVSVIRNENFNYPFELMYSEHIPQKTTAIAIGMGLGNMYSNDELKELILNPNIPMIIDADMFYKNIITEVLKKDNIVLTPHPQEFASLLKIVGIEDANASKVQKNRILFAKKFCKTYPHIVLVLKGANPIIAKGERFYINPLGSSILSKGGSGDVLSGIIGALLSQGYEPLDAAINGSLALSLAAEETNLNNYALSPFDLIEALKWLQKK